MKENKTKLKSNQQVLSKRRAFLDKLKPVDGMYGKKLNGYLKERIDILHQAYGQRREDNASLSYSQSQPILSKPESPATQSI